MRGAIEVVPVRGAFTTERVLALVALLAALLVLITFTVL